MAPGKEVIKMAVPKANQRAVNKYKKNNYDRIEITVPKGQRAVFQAHAAALGESVNGFINRAISETMERDAAGSPQEAAGGPQGAGVVSLSSETLEAAQRAAGEATSQFIARAVQTQAELDEATRKIEDVHGD